MKIKGVRKLSAGLLIFLFADERYTVNPFLKKNMDNKTGRDTKFYLFILVNTGNLVTFFTVPIEKKHYFAPNKLNKVFPH